MGQRRRARECALQLLYQLDVQSEADGSTTGPFTEQLELLRDQVALFWAEFDGDAEVREFAERLVKGVLSRRVELDETIQRSSKNWRLERMARVDRNILRLATYELFHLPDIPKRVTLNEAIELAKRFGAEDSGAFING